MDSTCGGLAPWLPWQEEQVGAERSPRWIMACQWTLVRYSANWLVGILYGAIRSLSEWQWPQVSATCSGCTGDAASFTPRISWTLWQSMQVATLVSPAA